MALEIDFSSPIGEQLGRIAKHKLEQARQLLRLPNDHPDEAVHDTRKLLKRLRALLRLVRASLPRAEFQALDEAAGRASRRLSHLREARATLDCLNAISPQLASVLSGEAQARIARALADTRLDAGADDTLHDATLLLLELERAWAHVPWSSVELPQLLDGLAATYGRARRRHRACRDTDPAQVFHDLRKAVKHHTHQLGMLRGLWPAWVEVHEGTAKALGDLLGLDHDLADLEERLADHRLALSSGERSLACGVLRSHSRALREEANPLRARLFAEPVHAFRQRTGAYARAASS